MADKGNLSLTKGIFHDRLNRPKTAGGVLLAESVTDMACRGNHKSSEA